MHDIAKRKRGLPSPRASSPATWRGRSSPSPPGLLASAGASVGALPPGTPVHHGMDSRRLAQVAAARHLAASSGARSAATVDLVRLVKEADLTAAERSTSRPRTTTSPSPSARRRCPRTPARRRRASSGSSPGSGSRSTSRPTAGSCTEPPDGLLGRGRRRRGRRDPRVLPRRRPRSPTAARAWPGGSSRPARCGRCGRAARPGTPATSPTTSSASTPWASGLVDVKVAARRRGLVGAAPGLARAGEPGLTRRRAGQRGGRLL